MSALESLLCNSCGAPLQVPTAANYVKCNHCRTQLAVRRDAGVTFTESIEKLNETTQNLSEQVARLTAQQEIAELDRRWEIQRQDFMISGKDGRQHLPTSAASTVGGIIAVVFGIFWTVMAFSITSNSPFGAAKIFPLFGLVFIAAGVFGTIHTSKKASEYREAQARYQRERARLKRESTVQGNDEEIMPSSN